MSLVANGSGVVSGKFTIPANVRAGTKRAQFNGSGGSFGSANFIGQGFSEISNRQMITTDLWYRYDPLAETFTLDTSQQITGVDIWFTAKGTTNIEVQLRETLAGVPSQTLMASSKLAPAAVAINGSSTRFNFANPISLVEGVEYAFVVLCDDAVTEVAVAELGKWDSVGGKWVTSQPYTIGVLLSSSNASTWTPHQEKDMTFRIVKASYTASSSAIALGSRAVVGVTDLIVRANVENPSGATRVDFLVTLPDASVLTVSAGQPIRLATPVTGTITIAAMLHGSTTQSPILHRDVQLIVGSVSTTADYVSRGVVGGTGVLAKVVLEAFLPGDSTLGVKVRGDLDAWSANLVPISSSPVGDGWFEVVYESAAMTAQSIQSLLTLAGSSSSRPEVRDLRIYTH